MVISSANHLSLPDSNQHVENRTERFGASEKRTQCGGCDVLFSTAVTGSVQPQSERCPWRRRDFKELAFGLGLALQRPVANRSESSSFEHRVWLAAGKHSGHGGKNNGRTVDYNNYLVGDASLPVYRVDGSVCGGADVISDGVF